MTEPAHVALDRILREMRAAGYRDPHIRANGDVRAVGTLPCVKRRVELHPGEAVPVCGESCGCDAETRSRKLAVQPDLDPPTTDHSRQPRDARFLASRRSAEGQSR